MRPLPTPVEILRKFDLDPPEAALLREARLLDCATLAAVPPPLRARLAQAVDHLRAHAEPAAAFRLLDPAGREAGFLRASASLAPLLDGAAAVALFCVTVGDAVDRFLEARPNETLLSFLMHAAGAALVEHLADQVQANLGRRARREGLAITRRFSPGYGDFGLENQAGFGRLLDFGRIGVAVTASHLLVPVKTVTAVAALKNVIDIPKMDV